MEDNLTEVVSCEECGKAVDDDNFTAAGETKLVDGKSEEKYFAFCNMGCLKVWTNKQ